MSQVCEMIIGKMGEKVLRWPVVQERLLPLVHVLQSLRPSPLMLSTSCQLAYTLPRANMPLYIQVLNNSKNGEHSQMFLHCWYSATRFLICYLRNNNEVKRLSLRLNLRLSSMFAQQQLQRSDIQVQH